MTYTLDCHLGRHDYREVEDPSPRHRGYRYRECTKCGKLKGSVSDDAPRIHLPVTGTNSYISYRGGTRDG